MTIMNTAMNPQYKDASLRPASTVILLRDKSPDRFEVFLLRRHEKSRFMGGTFVYPGGTLESRDKDREASSLCRCYKDGSEEQPKDIPFELLIAAIRELFEEAGILLAYRDGKILDLTDTGAAKRFDEYRQSLISNKTSLYEIAKKEKLTIGTDMLSFYSRWITPSARPVRFDTHFFITVHPQGQHASPDYKETIEGIWIRPEDALDKNEKGDIALSPPIIKTLEDLATLKDIADVQSIAGEPASMPIVPVLTSIGDELVILFPWNKDYPLFKKDGAVDYNDYQWPQRYKNATDRIIERNNRWYPVKRPTLSL